MLALRYHRRGTLEALALETTETPAPGPGEVLVRNAWASVNPVDWKLVTGQYRFLQRGGLPRGVGSDFAGVVAAVGPGVTAPAAGTRVFGCIDPFHSTAGAMAGFVALPVEAAFPLPDDVPLPAAAAMAGAGLSAVQVCELGRVTRADRVLVNGASGGVGHLAVQLALARGARVVAVASGSRRAFIESLGDVQFIDYRATDPRHWGNALDVVIDCVPSLPRRLHARLLRPGGRYVTTLPGAASYLLDPLSNRFGHIHRSSLMLYPTAAAAEELLSGYRTGQVRPFIEAEYPLREAKAALERSRQGRVQGKLLVRID